MGIEAKKKPFDGRETRIPELKLLLSPQSHTRFPPFATASALRQCQMLTRGAFDITAGLLLHPQSPWNVIQVSGRVNCSTSHSVA